MSGQIKVSGTVLSAAPAGEADKRLVIETCELGRITAFCTGCRRPGSPLLAAANPFVTGEFGIIPGRSSYRFIDASVKEYFRKLTELQPEIYIGFYFLELIDYYGREGIGGKDMLNLLYLALKALVRPESDKRLVRAVFEMRLITQNGEYAPDPDESGKEVFDICRFVAGAPLGKLFSLSLDERRKFEFTGLSDRLCSRTIDKTLKSRAIMDAFMS